jgi:hypothetical protein
LHIPATSSDSNQAIDYDTNPPAVNVGFWEWRIATIDPKLPFTYAGSMCLLYFILQAFGQKTAFRFSDCLKVADMH